MKKFVGVGLWLLCVLTCGAQVRPTPGTEHRICAECIRRNMEYLASDELRGRGSGTEDEHRAAEYIAKQLKAAGIAPAGNGGYVQRAATVHHTVNGPPQLRVLTGAG